MNHACSGVPRPTGLWYFLITWRCRIEKPGCRHSPWPVAQAVCIWWALSASKHWASFKFSVPSNPIINHPFSSSLIQDPDDSIDFKEFSLSWPNTTLLKPSPCLSRPKRNQECILNPPSHPFVLLLIKDGCWNEIWSRDLYLCRILIGSDGAQNCRGVEGHNQT